MHITSIPSIDLLTKGKGNPASCEESELCHGANGIWPELFLRTSKPQSFPDLRFRSKRVEQRRVLWPWNHTPRELGKYYFGVNPLLEETGIWAIGPSGKNLLSTCECWPLGWGSRQKEKEIKIKNYNKKLGESRSKNYLEEWRELTEGGRTRRRRAGKFIIDLKYRVYLMKMFCYLAPCTHENFRMFYKHIVSINL